MSKESNKIAVAKWRAKNKEKHLAGVKAWKKQNPEKVKAIHARGMKKWRAKHKERIKTNNASYIYSKKYGLTLEQVSHMFSLGCAICGEKAGRLCIDHCHTTGRVRGCLCHGCNVSLGFLKESPKLVLSLYNYIINNNIR